MDREETLRFVHEFHNQTTLTPVTMVLMAVSVVAVAIVPRRDLWSPLLFVSAFVAVTQRVVVFGLDFTAVRLVLLATWVRLFLTMDVRHFVWRRLDTVVFLWVFWGAFAYTILYGTPSAFINRLGWTYDALGLYMLFRVTLKDPEDLRRLLYLLAIFSVPSLMAFVHEYQTGVNLFADLGANREISRVRDGLVRCQAAFPHPTMGGCFWGTLIPLFIWLHFFGDRARWVGAVGAIASVCIVILTHSSTTALVLLAMAGMGVGLYPFRRWTQYFALAAVAGVLVLDVVMKAPVYHLITRVRVFSGSTGYQRYRLIDSAIEHFDEWWAWGTISTQHWGRVLDDVANQYIYEGVRGGMGRLGLFVLVLVVAFWSVGTYRARHESRPSERYLGWAVGVSLYGHAMAFWGVSYFGQIFVVFFLVLAACASLGGLPAPPASLPEEPNAEPGGAY